jgi:hypothetical protein
MPPRRLDEVAPWCANRFSKRGIRIDPMRFQLISLFFVVLGLVVPGQTRGDEAAIAQGKRLLQEGDRLADQGEYTEAVIRYKRAMEQLLPGLRRIPFKHEVKRDVTKRENMKLLILKEIDEDMTPAEFRANELAMKAFGLLPREFKLREVLAQVYSEEVAAFYDPKTKTMHLIEEPKEKVKKPPTLLERLFGKKNDFDKEENKTVIAHELTHALADQNYDLDAMQKAVKKDDDRSLALSALIEGEATLAMFGAGMDDWDGNDVTKLPAGSLEWTFNLISPFLPFMGAGSTLRSVPPIISESMIFPYFRGMVFCATLTNKGGWAAIDEVYKSPPLSTEQILHPEKYRAMPDYPMSIDLGTLKPGDGWKEVGRNVLGEMQLGVMLRKHGAKAAAAGWDGDHYAVFEGPNKTLGLVWLSTWDSEDEASEFMKAYVGYQTSKEHDLAKAPKRIPSSVWRGDNERLYVVQRQGSDVAVIEGFPADVTPSLLDAALHAKRTELIPVERTKEPAKRGAEAAKPRAEATTPGADRAKPGADTAKPGAEATKPGALRICTESAAA